MMETLLSVSSPMIDTSSLPCHTERVSPVTIAEFDGETVLCRVCGDRASGFHYGVHACEGCKGFFRRSIQQKIQYRPCLKNQQCSIQRVNRNRCQYCRLKKCIAVGMSRDAVRFGRVPKKEKARIIEQMQKKNLASQSSELNTLLANDCDVMQAVVASHHRTCDISQLQAHQMHELALHNQEYVNCPANMACPLNNEINRETRTGCNNLGDFSESFTPAIRSVVDFAKGIPGFILLNQDDQVTLLKAGTFEVLLVRLACLFDSHSNTMLFIGGKLFKRQPTTMTTNVGFLLDSMFDFAERFNRMCLTDDEIALFSAVVLMSPDRPGIRNVEQVERIQNRLTEVLQNIVNTNHKEDGTLFAKLLMKTTDLRTLNTLHSEKSIAGQHSEHERRKRQSSPDSDMDFMESHSTRSSQSSPSSSEPPNIAVTSGYSGDSNLKSTVVSQRLSVDPSNHQQVVLRTPYGTFFREEMSGFYGMMVDQPRRRCNTLDCDTLTRSRLHTVEEGNHRRYTLDKDYINKMVNKLNDRLEARNVMRDSLSTSMLNSAAAAPIREEGNNQYPVQPRVSYPSNQTLRTSPSANLEAATNVTLASSTLAAPKNRSHLESCTQENYADIRPRCYSFHLNSEGRAARMSLQNKMATENHSNQNSFISQCLSQEPRRGSFGAAFGLQSHSRSSQMNCPRGGEELDKRAATHASRAMKNVPNGSLCGMQLTAKILTQHPSLWQPHSMGANVPVSVPMMHWKQEDIMRSIDARNCVSTLPQNDFGEPYLKGSTGSTDMTESLETTLQKTSRVSRAEPERHVDGKQAVNVNSSSPTTQVTSASFGPENKKSLLTNLVIETLASDSAVNKPDIVAATTQSVISDKENSGGIKTSSLESPVNEDFSSPSETFGHKKFDKFRKEKPQTELTYTERMKGLPVKEERMEEDKEIKEDIDEKELEIDVSEMKDEQKLSSISTLSPSSEKIKPSAKETHPNLLAFLTNTSSGMKHQPQSVTVTAPSTMVTATTPAYYPWAVHEHLAHSQHQAHLHKNLTSAHNMGLQGIVIQPSPITSSLLDPACSPQSSSTAPIVSPTICFTQSDNAGLKAASTKDLHTSAVCHLKDKMLCEYDSKEKNNTGQVSPVVTEGKESGTKPVTSDSCRESDSGSPTKLTTLPNHVDLNKELATKLTLSPSSSSSHSEMITTSLSPASLTSTAASAALEPVCPVPSHDSRVSYVAMTSASPSHADLRFVPSGSSQPTSLSHMLMSQGANLTSHLQIYHSLLYQQYQALRNAPPPATNHCQIPQLSNIPHISSMQHLSQRFAHNLVTPRASLNVNRLEVGPPLNLSAKVDDADSGPSSPSHNLKTPA